MTDHVSKEHHLSVTPINPQRRNALAAANRIRSQRAILINEIRQVGFYEGRHILADAIEQLPDWLESLTCDNALGLAPRVGSERADDLLAQVGVFTRRTLVSLSPRQRSMLAGLLRTIGAEAVTRAAA